MKSEAYYLTHPLGKLELRFFDLKMRARVLPDRLAHRVAFALPRKVALWCLIRIAAGTSWARPPDTLTYDVMYKAWEAGEGR